MHRNVPAFVSWVLWLEVCAAPSSMIQLDTSIAFATWILLPVSGCHHSMTEWAWLFPSDLGRAMLYNEKNKTNLGYFKDAPMLFGFSQKQSLFPWTTPVLMLMQWLRMDCSEISHVTGRLDAISLMISRVEGQLEAHSNLMALSWSTRLQNETQYKFWPPKLFDLPG